MTRNDGPDPAVDRWLAEQRPASAAGMRACVSATHLLKERPGFGQTIVPKRGSVLASPVAEIAEGEPDYFFHWVRDAALLIDAALPLAAEGDPFWQDAIRDWGRFNLGLSALDGRLLAASGEWRNQASAQFQPFVRAAAELNRLWGSAIPGDVRFNPDGTLDTILWSRPQHDGPSLEALVCLRLLEAGLGEEPVLSELIRRGLDYTLVHERSDGVDIWEEQTGDHFYPRLLQYAALLQAIARGLDSAGRLHSAANRLSDHLEAFWNAKQGHVVTRITSDAGPPTKLLDSSTLLALLHAGLSDGPFAATGERTVATLEALERAFAAYPLNQGRQAGVLEGGMALGRFIGDVYATGGPWYLCTFAAAELRYRRAVVDPGSAATLVAAGDRTLAAAMATIPPSGALTEQFDPESGAQSSARDLGWSHAALLTAAGSRDRALTALTGS